MDRWPYFDDGRDPDDLHDLDILDGPFDDQTEAPEDGCPRCGEETSISWGSHESHVSCLECGWSDEMPDLRGVA